jgi:hypothetical protein
MTQIINFSNIVESNGKTIRQNNLEAKHKYPIGTLVEFEWDELSNTSRIEKTKVRAFVCCHERDCDGTPLYSMSMWDPLSWHEIGRDATPENYAKNTNPFSRFRLFCDSTFKIWFHNYGEDSLTEVR